MKILCIGDVTSPGGITHLEQNLWKFREREKIDFTIVNGENASFITGISGELARQLLQSINGDDFDSERFFAERWVQFRELVANGVEEKAGCYELLAFLKENGIKTALATSTTRELAVPYLYKSKLPEYLDAIVFGDEVERGKPNPDIFLEAGRRIGAKADEAFVVGDSSFDMIGGHRAGMRPVMVIDHNPPSDEARPLCHAIFNSLFEVIELIKKENEISSK